MATVLIIDGDAAAAQALQEAVAGFGIQTVVTGDGTEGLNLARSASPGCIVLCVELSRVSGYSICNKLKKDPALASIPLILTSSQATEETFEQHKKLKTRADAYLKKPYEISQILTAITQYIPEASGGGAGSRRTAASDAGASAAAEFVGGVTEDLDLTVDAPQPPPAPTRLPAQRSGAALSSGSVHASASSTGPVAARRPAAPAVTAAASDDEIESLLGPVSRPTAPLTGGSATTATRPLRPHPAQSTPVGQPTAPLAAPASVVGSGAAAGASDEDQSLVGFAGSFDAEATATMARPMTSRPVGRDSPATAGNVALGATKAVHGDTEGTSAPSSRSPETEAVEDEMEALVKAPSDLPAAAAGRAARAHASAAEAVTVDSLLGPASAPITTTTGAHAPVASAAAAHSPTAATAGVAGAAARRPATTLPGGMAEGQAETLRNENRQLRQRLQALEQSLQQKELEFNDRLLQESGRSRESVELKKRLTLTEREIEKYRQSAETARAEADEAKVQATEAREAAAAAESERQTLGDKLVQLVDKVKEVVAERDQLQSQLEAAGQQTEGAQAELEQLMVVRDKAKKAVDIALQLLDETGLAPPT